MEKEDGRIIFYITPFTALRANLVDDPFAAFWDDVFEAQSVSPLPEHERLVRVDLQGTEVSAAAYWKLTEGWAVFVKVD